MSQVSKYTYENCQSLPDIPVVFYCYWCSQCLIVLIFLQFLVFSIFRLLFLVLAEFLIFSVSLQLSFTGNDRSKNFYHDIVQLAFCKCRYCTQCDVLVSVYRQKAEWMHYSTFMIILYSSTCFVLMTS